MEAVGTETEETSQGRAADDIFHACFFFACVFAVGFFLADFTADFQDFSSSPAFRIRQVAVDDHSPAQGDGEQDPERAAAGAEQQGLPEREALPVPQHEQARQDEDDCR